MSLILENEVHEVSVEDLLMEIIKQLKITNIHLSILSDENITEQEVDSA